MINYLFKFTLIFIFYHSTSSFQCRNIAKVYHTKSIFGTQTTKTAFRNVSIDLSSSSSSSNSILCIVGTSGSGKSTLVKCASFLEDISYGSISLSKSTLLLRNTIPTIVCTAYLGLQFREVYDVSKPVSNFIIPTISTELSTIRCHPSFIRILEVAYRVMDIESILGTRLNGLLESQRTAFNVYTGIQSALLSQSTLLTKAHRDVVDRWGGQTTSRQLFSTTDADGAAAVSSTSSLESPLHITICLVLDEHLDKMASSVRQSILTKIRQLIATINSIPVSDQLTDRNILPSEATNVLTEHQCVVFVVTHFARVMRDCNSRSAVMNNGRLYDIQDTYQKLTMPAQLQLLD